MSYLCTVSLPEGYKSIVDRLRAERKLSLFFQERLREYAKENGMVLHV